MRRRLLILACLFTLFLQAEILTPIRWSSKLVNDSLVEFTAQMDSGWHLTIINIGDSLIGEDFYDTYIFVGHQDDTIRYVACDDHQCLSPEIYAHHNEDNVYQGLEQTAGSDNSLWYIFLMGLLGGLLAIFTPCVWPIIPMTVSFFLKRGGGKTNAILYGVSIIVIYVGLGLLITVLFGASALNEMATNAVLNLFFFALLVAFALSFFGLFDLSLPASWATRLDQRSRQAGGFLSVLLMAFTLVIVSFSCTGPIIGTLLVEAASMSLLAPAIGMTGFALALALPFSLLALFPEWLQRLPKSGEWMNSLKVGLGCLELALSLKFLSVADTAYGWNILPRWLFFALWIVCFGGLGVYWIRRSKVEKVLAIMVWLFTLYLIPGLWGAPVKAVSAFAPPMPIGHQDVFNDYEQGIAYARQEKKPILLDFSGYGCVNCRKMEAYVLSDEQVNTALEDYVLITLYVDSRMDDNHNGIPDGEEYSRMEREQFGSNAQPLYVKLDNNGHTIGQPIAYTTNPDLFLQWLNGADKKD